jgi:hypothetical protein
VIFRPSIGGPNRIAAELRYHEKGTKEGRFHTLPPNHLFERDQRRRCLGEKTFIEFGIVN